MVRVTQQAREELKALLHSNTKDSEDGIRLAYGSMGQFGFILSKPKEGDEALQEQGKTILLVGWEFKRILDGATLDVEYDSGKREFVMIKK